MYLVLITWIYIDFSHLCTTIPMISLMVFTISFIFFDGSCFWFWGSVLPFSFLSYIFWIQFMLCHFNARNNRNNIFSVNVQASNSIDNCNCLVSPFKNKIPINCNERCSFYVVVWCLDAYPFFFSFISR